MTEGQKMEDITKQQIFEVGKDGPTSFLRLIGFTGEEGVVDAVIAGEAPPVRISLRYIDEVLHALLDERDGWAAK